MSNFWNKSIMKSKKHSSNKQTADTDRKPIKPQKSKSKFIVNPDYKDVIILSNPQCTLADLIRFIASYPNKHDIHLRGGLSGNNYSSYKISHLLTLYMTIYLKQRIKQCYKYDQYIDKYHANIPTMGDVQQIYRPYLDHLLLQIQIHQKKSKHINSGHDIINNLHIYMNKPILMGPIMTLSMNKKDLLVFGYIHKFQNKFKFYTQIIPWDVIKLIHIFFDPINKEYLERFEQIKKQIISIESQLNHLKVNNKNNDEIKEKQFELIGLYNKTRDIRFIEEYHPHLINKYLINTKEYKLKAKEFAFKISMMASTTFNKLFSEHQNTLSWRRRTLSHKPFLLALLKEIVPNEFDTLLLVKYKTEIEQQMDIYQDYIKLKLGWTGYPNITTYQSVLPDYILEIFKKENAWSTEIERKIMYQSNCKTSIGLERGTLGKSFTID